ncbi:MAG: trypsin-like peptidase domain-containing protein [Nitrospirae bacterium]|nr:trypsin-like peptidase domain-containing protein [Nitrospirota bacterium]
MKRMGAKMSRALVVFLLLLVPTAFWGAAPAGAKESAGGYALVEDLQNVFVEVAERVQPAVVNISPPSARTSEGVPLDSPSGQPKASGSGVIIDPGGLIVTNNHVVGSYDEVTVLLSDLRKYTGKVIGRDVDTDLALVRIEPVGKLPVVRWADIGKVKVGQWVIAVGNPFGLDRTVTVGIVSGLGREDVNLSRYENFIQTDASINPGNSGGPLLNIRGEMIGINTAIINFAQGIGFAIPADMAQYVVDQILSHGKVARGWLGVLTPNTLSRVIGTMPPQKKVHIDVVREGREKRVEVKLGEREDEKESSPSVSLSSTEKPAVDIGIEVRKVTQELKEKYSLERSEGVVVTRVESGSLADREGLRSGDLIVEIDREAIDDVESFNKEIGKLQKGESFLLRVMRDNRAFYLVLSLSN